MLLKTFWRQRSSAVDESSGHPEGPYRYSKIELEFLSSALEMQETPPSPLRRSVLWIVVALVALAVAWSFLGKIDVSSTSIGRIIPAGKIKVVQTVSEGAVTAISVREGDHVRAGQVIVELDKTVAAAELFAAKQKLAFLEAQIERLNAELMNRTPDYSHIDVSPDVILLHESLRSARENANSARLAEARNVFESKSLQVQAGVESVNKIQSMSRIAREKEERVRPYVGTVMTKFDYLNLKNQVEQSESDLAVQRQYLNDAKEQAQAALQRVRQVESDHRSQITEATNDSMMQLVAMRSNVERAAQTLLEKTLKAPVDGQVLNLAVTTVGAALGAGKTVATIVPRGSELVVEGRLLNEDSGFVKIGQHADIKIDTFSYQKYGSISAVVVAVSPDSEPVAGRSESDASSGQAAAPSNSYTFVVRMKLERDWLTVNGERRFITPGMTVQADIVTERRRIVDFLLSPVIKYVDDGFKPR